MKVEAVLNSCEYFYMARVKDVYNTWGKLFVNILIHLSGCCLEVRDLKSVMETCFETGGDDGTE